MNPLAEVISRFTQRRPPPRAVAYFVTAIFVGALGGWMANAQDTPSAPLAPPPEHDVRRLGTETTRAANGQVISKVVQKPQSTLHYFNLETEDVRELDRIPSFPLTSSQLVKYDLKYIGQEQVDEIDCYIFKVKPKALDRTHAYLDGLVWVDTKYLEVVKTYGRWVNELGDVRSATLPFTLFETYRENVDGKYWFPNYARSDDTLHLKDVSVPLRLVIKWTNFKPLPAMAPAAAAPTAKPQS